MPSRKTPTEDLDSIDIALIGGYDNDSGQLKNIDVIRICAGVVTISSRNLPQLPIGLYALGGVFISDRREILISGGYSSDGASPNCFSLNIDGESWKKVQRMTYLRCYHSMITELF